MIRDPYSDESRQINRVEGWLAGLALAALVALAVAMLGCGSYHATGVRAYRAAELGQGPSALATHEARFAVSDHAAFEVAAGVGVLDKTSNPGDELAGFIAGCLRYGGDLAGLVCGRAWRVEGEGWSKSGEAIQAGASYRTGRHETLLLYSSPAGPDAEEIIEAGYRFAWGRVIVGISAESHRWRDATGPHSGARYPLYVGWRW